MKYWKCLGAAAVLMTGCSAQTNTDTDTEIANPWSDYETLAEAETGSGVTLTLSDTMPFTYTTIQYRAMDGMIEADYETDTGEVMIRKTNDAGMENVSGDYTEYTVNEEINVEDVTVTIAGEENCIHSAEWHNDSAAYSVSMDAGGDRGLSKEQVIAIVKSIS